MDEESSEVPPKHFHRRRLLMGVIALILLIVGITGVTITCFVLEQKVLQYRHHYGIIFDAGSSKTDITVYRWPSDLKDHGTAHTEQIRYAKCSDSGISNFEKNPIEAGKMIKRCVDNIALKSLPHKDIKKTGIYLGATAGMRLLCKRNRKSCNQILDSIKQALNSYKFRQTRNRVRVLTGKEEATFGWITANLLRDAFKSDVSPDNNTKLIGSLDMGGASAEVAFIPQNASMPTEYGSEFMLYGQNYTLYTYSYSCFGFKESQRRLMAHLVEASNFTNKVINPCWHKGYNETVPASWVWQLPCVTKKPPIKISNGTMYKFVGNGSTDACKNRIRELFNQTVCEHPNCTFDGTFQPPVKGHHFMAHSGFGYIGKFHNISKGDHIRVLKEKGENFCEKDWQQVLREKGDEMKAKILRSVCYESLYSYEILTTGFHFEPESNDVQLTLTINGTEVGWSLGFMVSATNAIPTEAPTYRLTDQEFVALLTVCSVMAVFGLGMLTVGIVKKKLEQNMKYKYRVINN